MSEKIHELIGSVREKSILLKDQLMDEKSRNTQLEAKLSQQQADLEAKSEEVTELKSQVEILKKEVEAAKSSVVSSSEPKAGISDDQIDELVREIDFCIAQLKK